jgi:NADH-quinone oxidoreductase subunit M
MGGLWKLMPVFGVFMLIATFASIGLPGLNGFVGEFVILSGVLQSNVTWAVFATLGIVLGAWYMLNWFRQTMQGPLVERKGETLKPMDLTARETWALIPIIILIFVLGIVPNLVFNSTEPSAARLINSVQVTSAVAEK